MIAQPQTDVGRGQALKPVSTQAAGPAMQLSSSTAVSSGWRDVSALSALEGQIRVFTSAHRHFFTHVFSQALRDAGQGTTVLIVQFFKGGIHRGPQNPTHLGQNLDWVRCELPHSIHVAPESVADREAVLSLWDYTCDAIQAERYEQVILEELSLAVFYDIVPEADVLALLEDRPRYMDITLTGQRMPRKILQVANQVTELRNLFDVPLDSPLPSLKPRRSSASISPASMKGGNQVLNHSRSAAHSAAGPESWISPGQMQIPGLELLEVEMQSQD